MKKETRIKREYDRLSAVFSNLPGKERAVIEGLLKQASFMLITLEDLSEAIKRNGTTEEYRNGANQSGMKQTAEMQSYNNTMKNYLAIMKQLQGFIPEASRSDLDNPLMNLLGKKKTVS